ncbi:MAG: deoxyuridine 5'-triphosphate nucleotidohydrolase [Promethearchaeota archaeon]
MLPSKLIFQNIQDLINLKVQRQPNGVDLTLQKLAQFAGSGVLDFDNSHRALPPYNDIPVTVNNEYNLEAGSYLAFYNELVTVPSNCTALVLPRSSLMRMGAILFSALWDSGYQGRGVGLFNVYNPHGLKIYKNARIGQLVFFQVQGEVDKTYQGQFQKERV